MRIFLLLLLIPLLGCKLEQGAVIETTMVRTDSLEYTTVIIDGCQYLITGVHYGYSFTHKGNCTNSFHLR
jgi:hypothetical protein